MRSALLAALRWDLRMLVRSGQAYAVGGALTLLVAIAFANGLWHQRQWQKEVEQEQQKLATERADQLKSIAAKDEWAMMPLLASTRLVLPPAPLGDLTTGRADLDPRAAEVSAFTHQGTLFRDYQVGNPLTLALGQFDLGFVVVYLLPILIIALGYGVLSSERGHGIDRILSITGVSSRQLALGRVFGRACLTTLPFCVALIALAFVHASDGRLVRLLAASGVILGYAAFWWSVVWAVSSATLKERATLSMLVMAWLAFVMILPAGLGAASRSLHPPPSRFELIAQMRRADVQAIAAAETLMGSYMHDHPQLDPKVAADLPKWLQRNFVASKAVDEAVKPIVAKFDDALLEQQSLVRHWSVISPAVVTQRALAEIAGTSESRSFDFRRQAQSFAVRFREEVAVLGLSVATLEPAMLADLPSFAFVEPPAMGIVRSAIPSIIGLWGAALFLAAIAWRRLR
jgi:ABC-2 type transport system permease protein